MLTATLNNNVKKSLNITGDGTELSILKSDNLDLVLLKVGTSTDNWGSGGSLRAENFGVVSGSDWATSTGGVENKGLVEIYNCSRLKLKNISISNAKNSGLYVNNLGYSSIDNCNVGGCKYDCIFFDSTNVNFAVTSTSISNSQVSTGLQSSIHLNNVLNVTIDKCQLEDSETALLITGNDNRNITFKNNYVEATRGDYDIDASSGCGSGFSFHDNYLFGTPNISSIIQPTSPDLNFAPLHWNNNFGSTDPETLNVINTDLFAGMTSSEGVARVTVAHAKSASQQTATIEARTENGYGAGLKSSSVGGEYVLGMLRGSKFDATGSTQAYFTQRYDNSGAINTAPDNYALHIFGGSGAGAKQSLKCSHVGGDVLHTGGLGYSMTGSPNSSTSALYIYHPNNTDRSISASGTINASGADYAEYENNNGLILPKGSIIGFKADGTLTNKYSESFRFGVKSTNPAYVGGDVWGAIDIVGECPMMPTRGIEATDAEYELVLNKYKQDKASFEYRLETERAKVDRIAYAGKCPVNVTGALAGQYIVAVAIEDDDIRGVAVNKEDMTFKQYQNSIGRVNKILDDGRAEVVIIIH
jgi:hypothetical protein